MIWLINGVAVPLEVLDVVFFNLQNQGSQAERNILQLRLEPGC